MTRSPTRELARRAVQQEIADVAERLFLEHGYDKTTVDDIAQAAGIAPRTFFRYFATKDEALFLMADRARDVFLGMVDERPADESPWDTLQTVLLDAVRMSAEGSDAEWSEPLQRIVNASPALTGVQLQRHDQLQRKLGDRLMRRSGLAEDAANGAVEATFRALAGSAMAVIHGAMQREGFQDLDVATRLELIGQVFEALRPGDPRLGGAP